MLYVHCLVKRCSVLLTSIRSHWIIVSFKSAFWLICLSPTKRYVNICNYECGFFYLYLYFWKFLFHVSWISIIDVTHFFFFLFYLFIYLFIYFWLCWVLGSREGPLQLRQAGATPHRGAGTALHRGARASLYRGPSRCGAQAPDAQAQQLWLTGPAAPRHAGSSQTRARTRVPCTSRQILNHCATREALDVTHLIRLLNFLY